MSCRRAGPTGCPHELPLVSSLRHGPRDPGRNRKPGGRLPLLWTPLHQSAPSKSGGGRLPPLDQKGASRPLALKMILAGGHAGEQELARFRREAEAVARLQHPNIVQIYEIGGAEGRPYLSLEFVDGGNLADHLNGTPVPARRGAHLVEAL